MHVRLVDNATDWLAATSAWRATDPIRTNILGSIAQGVVDGRKYEDEHWFVVEDGSDVVGGAVWTLPHKLVMGPMSEDAAHAVGAAAAGGGRNVPGVNGPVAVARAAATGVGGSARVDKRERILVLHDYVAPGPIEGRARLAGEDDAELVVEWLDAFMAEADLLSVDNRAAERASRGRLWIWDVDGVATSMAGHASVVATPGGRVGRVGPVYTPPARRGRGYASAVTAAVVERLAPDVDAVILYTDAANPTSNAIYERLGFVHTDDVVELWLD